MFICLFSQSYKNVMYFLVIGAVLSLLLFSISFFLSLSNLKDREKLSEYECGFEPFDSATRHPFDVHFYIVGILFLIFDVEIAILLPWVLGLKTMGWLGINVMFFVLLMLTVGFIYEWKRGALIWPKQNGTILHRNFIYIDKEKIKNHTEEPLEVEREKKYVGLMAWFFNYPQPEKSKNSICRRAWFGDYYKLLFCNLMTLSLLVFWCKLIYNNVLVDGYWVYKPDEPIGSHHLLLTVCHYCIPIFCILLLMSTNCKLEKDLALSKDLPDYEEYYNFIKLHYGFSFILIRVGIYFWTISYCLASLRVWQSLYPDVQLAVFENIYSFLLFQVFLVLYTLWSIPRFIHHWGIWCNIERPKHSSNPAFIFLVYLLYTAIYPLFYLFCIFQFTFMAFYGYDMILFYSSLLLYSFTLVINFIDTILIDYFIFTYVQFTLIFSILAIILKLSFNLQNTDMIGRGILFYNILKITISTLSGVTGLAIGFLIAHFLPEVKDVSGYSELDEFAAYSTFNFHTEWTSYSSFFQILIMLSILIILYASYLIFQYNNKIVVELPIIVLLMTLFLICLLDACDFFVSFICIMGFSLNIYVLILSNAMNKQCCEAAIKYFYLSSIASGLLAFSLWLNYLTFFSLNFITIEDTLKEWDFISDHAQGIIATATYFLCYGLFFKLAAFPCHLWAASVYEGSPFPVMAFFVLPIKTAVLAFVFKIFYTVLKDIYNIYVYIFWFSAFFSMLFGALSALVEKKVKKFLAYSSINQMGFLLMGIVGGSSMTLQASILYLVIYVITNLGLFIILLNTFDYTTKRTILYITDFTSFGINVTPAIFLSLILFSMAGIPPLVGFFGKYYLFISLFEAKFYSLVIAGMFTSLVSAYYYLKIIKQILFESPRKTPTIFKVKLSKGLEQVLYFIIMFLILSIFIFDIFLSDMVLAFSNLILFFFNKRNATYIFDKKIL